MKPRSILTIFFTLTFFISCSKPEQAIKRQAPAAQSASPEAPQASIETVASNAIPQATLKLKHPDFEVQINGIRELREIGTPEACKVLIEKLKEKEAQIPESLDQNATEKTGVLLNYLGALLGNIRKMDQLDGNLAVATFVNAFQAKHGDEAIGKRALSSYKTQLSSIEKDLANGIYKDKPMDLGH